MSRWHVMEAAGAVWTDRLDNIQDLRDRGFVTGSPSLSVRPDGAPASTWDGTADQWENFYSCVGVFGSGTNPITVLARVKTSSTHAAGNGVLCQGTEIILRPYPADSTRAEFILNSFSSNDRVQSTATINDGAWHLIAGVYDGASMHIYVDDNAAVSVVPTGSYGGSTANWEVAHQSSGGFFNGSIADLAIFARGLTAAEILAIATYQL